MARHRLEALNLLRAAHTAIYYIRVYGRVLNHDASFKIPKASAVQKPVRLEVRGIYPDTLIIPGVKLLEDSGVEPLTSCMPCKRSTN
jgi:hypothetical protein